MRRPTSLWSKIILVLAVLVVFVVCFYLLNLQTNVILVFIISPIIIIVLGKIAELVIYTFERVSTGPLFITGPRNTLLLFGYYMSISILIALLIENSVILTLLNFSPDEWQVAFVSLSLAFLPRVLSYASSMERARGVLLGILTPLTLTATIVLLTQPSSLAFRAKTLQFCFVGSLIQPVFGDLTLYFVGFLGIIHPRITIETISFVDLQRLVSSQLETIQWERICQVLKEAKGVGRVDIINKIVKSMSIFLEESRKRGTKLARINFFEAIAEAIYSEPDLKEELTPFFETLNEDPDTEFRARIANRYGILSKAMPAECLQYLSGFLNDQEVDVLNGVGASLSTIVKNHPQATRQIIELSLNQGFLDWLKNRTAKLVVEHGRTPSRRLRAILEKGEIKIVSARRGAYNRTVMTVSDLESPIIQALKQAYIFSAKEIVDHIQSCCSSQEPRLRVLAAIVLDEKFAEAHPKLLQMRNKLKKDKNKHVHNAVEMHRVASYLKNLFEKSENITHVGVEKTRDSRVR